MARHTSPALMEVTLVIATAGVVGAMAVRPGLAAPDPPPVGQGPAQSATEWTVVNSPTGFDLLAVSARSGLNMWAVGREGTILRWNGSLWQGGAATPYSALNAVAMVSDTDGWAVGDYGVIRRWDGTGWVDVASPTDASLTSVAMVSPVDGWAVGWPGTILRWNGATWERVRGPDIENEDLTSVALAAADDGWAVGWSGLILHWDGLAWSRAVSPTSEDLAAVAVVAANEAWAVGRSGTILQWNGARWSVTQSPTQRDLSAVAMASADQGWAVGQAGTILHWDGSSWLPVASPTTVDLAAVAVVGDAGGCAVGREGVILHYGTFRATSTPAATGTPTPGPTSTQTLTVTPGPSPTPEPTATCPPGWEPRLELSFEPAAVRGGQAVTAHLEGHSFGFYTANVSLSMAGQRTIQHGWRSDRGWIGSASFGFAAPAASGTWTAYASGYGEVAFCMNGSLAWGYGGTGSRQVPLEVSGAMLFLPDVDRSETPEDGSRTSERAGELLAGPWSPTDHGRHAIGEPR